MEGIFILLAAIDVVLCIISLLLHMLGVYLLNRTQSSSIEPNQRLFLLHLSINEIIFTVVCSVWIFIQVLYPTSWWNYYMWIITICLIGIPRLLIFFMLTLDRFLKVYLNIKYEIYVTGRMTRIVNGIFVGEWYVSILPICHSTWFESLLGYSTMVEYRCNEYYRDRNLNGFRFGSGHSQTQGFSEPLFLILFARYLDRELRSFICPGRIDSGSKGVEVAGCSWLHELDIPSEPSFGLFLVNWYGCVLFARGMGLKTDGSGDRVDWS